MKNSHDREVFTMISWLTSGDGIDALHAEEVVTPQPSATGVLVRTDAHSLNYRDLLVVEGVEGWRPDKPVVPLSDGTGTITHVG